jgi:serine phosphatase RsbU (regulator of sigma subunit)
LKRFLIIFSLVFFSIQNAYTQNYGSIGFYLVDSLNLDELSTNDSILIHGALQKYHGALEDIDKVKALDVITEGMMHNDWEKYNTFVRDLVESHLATNLSPELEKRYLHSLASAVNNAGIIFNQKGKIPEALNCFLRSLKIQERIGDEEGSATTINNIGTIYNIQGNIEKTLEYVLKSLSIREKIGDKKGIAQSLNNLGSIYFKLTDYPKALSYFKKALKINEEIKNSEGIAYSLTNIGNVYDFDNLLLGINYHKRSLKLRQEIGDRKGQVIGLLSVGYDLFELGNRKEALTYAKESYELGILLELPDYIQKTALLLSQIYQKSGKYKEGWDMYVVHINLRDSIVNKKNKDFALKQGKKYDYEKEKAIQNAEHNKQLEIIAEREEKQRVISYAIAGVLVLSLVFGFFFMNRLRVTRGQKLVIEEQKKLVDEKNQEITDSITYAKRIQEAILPPIGEMREKLKDGFVYYKPKDIIAGDFYWLEQVGDVVLYAVADCTGHGVPGAMVSIVCNNTLNRAVREFKLINPAEILDKVRELVIETFEKSDQEVKDGMDIALCAIDIKTNKLQFAGANNPIYIIRNGVLLETKGDKQAIGRFAGSNPYTKHEFDIEEGDSIYTFTDGYPDQFGGEKGKKLKYKPFKELLIKLSAEKMDVQHHQIEEAFLNWKGDLEQIDDVCVIGVRI